MYSKVKNENKIKYLQLISFLEKRLNLDRK